MSNPFIFISNRISNPMEVKRGPLLGQFMGNLTSQLDAPESSMQ
jgi:hypothetical protein